ncbi:MAG: TfoX/Sxy family protein [Chloroflexi bacterium]|nr:TfoX/Sxy family protein [Chloroflexota bacterium]
MKISYLDDLKKLLDHAHPGLASSGGLDFKNVFGAVAGYVDGNIFVTCGKFGVALKLPSETLEELLKERDVERLRYFPKGHIKKEYVVLPERMLADERLLKELLEKSVRYVGTP